MIYRIVLFLMTLHDPQSEFKVIVLFYKANLPKTVHFRELL